MILKESKSWREKKEERKLDISRKRYVRDANTNRLVNKHMILHLTSVLLARTTETQDHVPES